MSLHHQLKRLFATTTDWLRGARKPAPRSVTSLSAARKLAPIDDVVARVRREPFAPDRGNRARQFHRV
jgi:hypothetical protein